MTLSGTDDSRQAHAGGRLLLLIDDDDAIRDSIADVLTGEGFDVTCASNGHEGLALLRDGGLWPCLVLLDWMMPVMDGEEFLRRVRADERLKDINVIAISASTKMPPDVPHIRKPFDLEEFLSVVQRFCRT